MKIAHLSDLHLGFRQFERTASNGMNAREHDVARAWGQAVESVIPEQPDLILLAGDQFHSVRPTNRAIVTLYQGLARWREQLPRTPIVMIAGNHDSPHTREPGMILDLYRELGVHVLVEQAARLQLAGVSLLAVPHRAVRTEPLEPDPAAELNVLLLHAGVEGQTPTPVPDSVTDEMFEGFDYVALGDYHVCRQVAPNAWYPGSLEYTSSDPWGESRERPEKGWLRVDLGDQGADVTFMPVATRRFLDLPPIDATGQGAAELSQAIDRTLAAAPLEEAVTRLRVTDVDRFVKRDVDYEMIRRHKARAWHLQLELRSARAVAMSVGRLGYAQPLDVMVRGFLTDRTLPPDIDRAALVEAGERYLLGNEDPYGLPHEAA